jgi:hypothetical protein
MTMFTRKALAAFQPEAGDIYVHCGHVEPGETFHVWKENARFIRPDGSEGEAKWLACCGPCFHGAEGDREGVRVQGDATWDGDDLPLLMADNPAGLRGDQPSTGARHQGAARGKAVEARQSGGVAFDMSAFSWWPELASSLQDAANELGTADLVILDAKGSGPAGAIEKELREGRVSARVVALHDRGSSFAVSTEAAIRLLRIHGQAGGRFVADHLEGRAHRHECWTMNVGAGHVDACSHSGAGPGLFVRADFDGRDTYEGAAKDEWFRGSSLEVTTSRYPGRYQRDGLA